MLRFEKTNVLIITIRTPPHLLLLKNLGPVTGLKMELLNKPSLEELTSFHNHVSENTSIIAKKLERRIGG